MTKLERHTRPGEIRLIVNTGYFATADARRTTP
jgi:hypothetical protein